MKAQDMPALRQSHLEEVELTVERPREALLVRSVSLGPQLQPEWIVAL